MFIKVASYILVLSLIVSVFSINIYAEEPKDDTYLNTYAAHYFNHLTSNFGNNEENTCGYVAAGMLLSFYDSYLNDNFIMNDCSCDSNCDYDVLGSITSSTNSVSSPGIKYEDPWTSDGGEDEEEYADYNAFIDAKANEYFHLRLLKIGRDELGLYTPPTQNQRSSDSTTKPEDSPWGITISEVRDVMQAWFNKFSNTGEQGIIKNNVTIHISYSNGENDTNADDNDTSSEYPNVSIRNEMIKKVEAGIPVIYFGYDEVGKGGHFMIAHDYDEATDTLYFHTGWADHIMNDKDTENFVYTANTSILWFEIGDGLATLEHSCIYNYASSTSSTIGTLCGCQIYSGSSSHNHNYNGKKYNDDYHYTSCVCGKIEATSVKVHNLTYPGRNLIFHTEDCADCSYLNTIIHEYTTFLSHTETGHTLQCACGETRTEAHYDKTYDKCDDSLHKVYCECGYLTGYDFHSYVTVQLNFRMCSYCGYVKPKNPGPGQIIMGEEDEEPTTE